MIINCSACSTRYLVDPRALGAAGRRVRCAKCGATWYQEPPQHKPPEKKPAPLPGSEIPIVRPLAGRRPIPKGSNLPAVAGSHARSQLMSSLILVAVVAMVVGPGGYYFRDSIVDAWPPARKLYMTLDIPLGEKTKNPPKVQKPAETVAPVAAAPALDIRNLNVTLDGSGDKAAIIVRGEIYNLGDGAATLSTLHGAIVDAQQNVIYEWSFGPPQPKLGAHKVVAFESRVEESPEAMSFVRVGFQDDK